MWSEVRILPSAPFFTTLKLLPISINSHSLTGNCVITGAMKTTLFSTIFLILNSVYAADFEWFELQSLKCTASNGLSISYEAAADAQYFQTSWMSLSRKFYADGYKY